MFTNTSDAKQRQLASEPKFLEDLLISELNCSLAGLLACPHVWEPSSSTPRFA
jgi:hypothetical protein